MSAENNQKQSTGRGGARANAGRKAGTANVKTREIADKCAETGLTPLEVMLEIMLGTDDERLKLTAAQAAAPYVHAKLSSVELSGGVTVRAVKELSDDELAYIAASSK